jgi:hypothetical protein
MATKTLLHAVTLVAAVCLSLPSYAQHQSQGDPDDNPNRGPRVVGPSAPRPTPDIVVPRDIQTIQAAIEAVREGGTIFVEPGVYREKLTISGKSLRLSGGGLVRLEGSTSRAVDDADRAVGLINYLEGGGGVLEGFVLRGGLNGIVGQSSVTGGRVAAVTGERAAANLTVQDVTISNTGRGILWRTGGELTVLGTRIDHVRRNGILVIASPARLFNVAIINALGFGVLMQDTPSTGCSNSLTGVNIEVARVGIGVYRSGVCILDSFIGGSKQNGIYFEESAAVVEGTRIVDSIGTPHGPTGWQDGWAIFAVLTDLQKVANSKFENNAAGIYLWGSKAVINWDEFWCNSAPNSPSNLGGIDIGEGSMDPGSLRAGVPAAQVYTAIDGDPATSACECSGVAVHVCQADGLPEPPQPISLPN